MSELPNHIRNTGRKTRRKPANRTVVIAGASFLLGAVLGVAGTVITNNVASPAQATQTGLLKTATTSCAVSNNPGARLGDHDTSLSLNGQGSKDTSGISDMEFSCVLDAVKTPDYVRAEMQKTRALDGTQREAWGTISATWTYHPDTGLDVGLVEK